MPGHPNYPAHSSDPGPPSNPEPPGNPAYSSKKDKLQNRLRRIEGQVRGLQRMVDEDVYCIDVLTQIASVTKALQGVGMGLLDDHIRHCVKGAAGGAGDGSFDTKVEEVMSAVNRMLRT